MKAQHVRPRHLPTQITHMYFFACRTCTVYKLSFLPLKIIQFGNRNIANYQNRIWQKGSCVRLTLIFPLFISLLTCMKVFFFVYQAFYVPAQTIKVLYFITFYLSTSYIKIISTECVLNKINKSFLFVFRF